MRSAYLFDCSLAGSLPPKGEKTAPSRYEAGVGAAGEGGENRPRPQNIVHRPDCICVKCEDAAHARKTDPQTSHAAAASVVNLGEVREKILHMLGNWERTDEELWERYQFAIKAFNWKPCSPSGLRSRRSELVRMGLVVDSEKRGKTEAGRDSIIWRLA